MSPQVEGDVEVLLARYLETTANDGEPAAIAALADSPWREHVLRRVAALRHLGVLPDSARAAAAPLSLPRRVGDYQLEQILHGGAAGTLYGARHTRRHHLVAWRSIAMPASDAPALLARLRDDAAALRRLQHEGLCAIVEVGEHEGRVWCATERIDGAAVNTLIAAGPPRDRAAVDRCLTLIRDAARALGHAHAVGRVHCAVKASNLMLRGDGRVVVVDFGIASVASPHPTMDVLGLGVALCQLLTGIRSPLHDHRPAARLRALARDIVTVCLAATDPDPRRRHQDGAALAADLDRLLLGQPIAARRPALPVRTARLLRRHPVASSIVAGLLLLPLAAPALHRSAVAAASRSPAEARGQERHRLDDCRALDRQGRTTEALARLADLLADLAIRPAEHGELAGLRLEAAACYGELLAVDQRVEQGRAWIGRAIDELDRSDRRDRAAVRTRTSHGRFLQLAGEVAASSAAFDRAALLAREVCGSEDDLEALTTRAARAGLWQSTGRLREAETELRSLLAALEPRGSEVAEPRLAVAAQLGTPLRDPGQPAAAQQRDARAAADAAGPGAAVLALLDLARVKVQVEDLDGAVRDLERALSDLRRR